MGKKHKHPDLEEVLSRPWCYYCERDFDDLKILISHQKAKHFKCERCGRRLNTAGGLSVHMNQVHKESLMTVENALPNRANLDFEIFGMEGIPDDVRAAHNQRVLTAFHQAEAERRASTGNSGAGGNAGNGAKKPKFESPSDLRKRLAEHKAKKAAEEAAGVSSGDVTPMGAGMGPKSPSMPQSPAPGFQAGSPTYGPPPQLYGAPQGSPGAQPYGQPGFGYNQQQSGFSPQAPGFGAPLPLFSQGGPLQHPLAGAQPFQPPFSGGPPRGFGAASPLSYQQINQQPPGHQTPPQNVSRPPNLPSAPGLPQRPSFSAPPVNAFQLQQMHQGHIPMPQGSPVHDNVNGHQGQVPQQGGMQGQVSNSTSSSTAPPTAEQPSASATSIDDLISSVSKEADAAALTPRTPVPEPASEPAPEKKGKKEKKEDKNAKLVYSDNEVSPEEKLAKLERYAYTPDRKPKTVLGYVEARVTGTATGQMPRPEE